MLWKIQYVCSVNIAGEESTCMFWSICEKLRWEQSVFRFYFVCLYFYIRHLAVIVMLSDWAAYSKIVKREKREREYRERERKRKKEQTETFALLWSICSIMRLCFGREPSESPCTHLHQLQEKLTAIIGIAFWHLKRQTEYTKKKKRIPAKVYTFKYTRSTVIILRSHSIDRINVNNICCISWRSHR